MTRMTDNALVVTGGITADKMKVDQLDAVSARIGTLRTATSGARVEIADNIITGYRSNNTRAYKISA